MAYDVQRCFRSGNTLRITLGRYLRDHLNALPGDLLRFERTGPGRAALTNLSHDARTKPRGKTK